MATNADDKIKKLSPAQRKKVEARAAELIAEEMTLRELRHARKLTQIRMAKKLGITQDSVSRLEKRSDVLLSTLRKTVEAMGGTLSLVAEFPDREPVVLSGFAEDGPGPKPTGRRHALAKAGVCISRGDGGVSARPDPVAQVSGPVPPLSPRRPAVRRESVEQQRYRRPPAYSPPRKCWNSTSRKGTAPGCRAPQCVNS